MRLSRLVNRAALLGFAGVAACDVYAIASDPFPGLIQTWNLAIATTRISVASLLPAGVSIYSTPASNPPDSSAFTVSVNNIVYNRRVGGYCALCQALNGTTAPKPAFIISPDTGSSTKLPTDVVSGSVIGGMLSYTLNNAFSFDPLRVSANPANPQGRIVVVVSSGSVVFARDTVKGENASLPAFTGVLSRTLALQSGPIGDSITVDLEVISPAGDNTFMNANGLLTMTAIVTELRVGEVTINVPNANLSSGSPVDVDLGQLDETFTERAIGGGFEFTVTNPFAVAGNMTVDFATSDGPISASAPLAGVVTPQRLAVTLDSLQVTRILNSNPPATLSMGGAVSAQSPITVTPKQVISTANRFILKLRAFGGTD